VDGADSPKRDAGGTGVLKSVPLSTARSRHKVLRIVPRDREGRGSEAVEVASEESEFERVRGKMGAVGKRGMFVQIDSVRGVGTEEGGNELRRALQLRFILPTSLCD
jgi:hypothetical protein